MDILVETIYAEDYSQYLEKLQNFMHDKLIIEEKIIYRNPNKSMIVHIYYMNL